MKKLSKNPPNPYIQGRGQPSENALLQLKCPIKTSDKHHLVSLPQQNLLLFNKDQTTSEHAG